MVNKKLLSPCLRYTCAFLLISVLCSATDLLAQEKRSKEHESISFAKTDAEKPENNKPDVDRKKLKDWFFLEMGYKGFFSKDILIKNTYSYPFIDAIFSTRYVQCTIGYSRYQDYLLPDGYKGYLPINFNQFKAIVTVYPLDNIEISAEGRYSTGLSHYRSIEAEASFYFSIGKYSLEIMGTYITTQYSYNSLSKLFNYVNYGLTKKEHAYPSAEINFLLTKNINLSIGSDFKYDKYNYFYDPMFTYMFKIRLFTRFHRIIAASYEFQAGWDSLDYKHIKGNIGIIVKPIRGLALQITYGPGYHLAGKVSHIQNYTRLMMFLYPAWAYLAPLKDHELQINYLGETYFSHIINFAVTSKFTLL